MCANELILGIGINEAYNLILIVTEFALIYLQFTKHMEDIV